MPAGWGKKKNLLRFFNGSFIALNFPLLFHFPSVRQKNDSEIVLFITLSLISFSWQVVRGVLWNDFPKGQFPVPPSLSPNFSAVVITTQWSCLQMEQFRQWCRGSVAPRIQRCEAPLTRCRCRLRWGPAGWDRISSSWHFFQRCRQRGKNPQY